MAITAGEILFFLSAGGASAGYTTAGTVYSSPTGKYVSTTQVSGTALDNIFTDLTGAENATNQVDYACVFIMNTDSSDTMLNCIAWLPTSGFVAGGANITLATDNIGATNRTSSSAQAATTSGPLVAPSGVSAYVSPSATSATGAPLANIAPNQVAAVWIKRTATNSGPVNNDGFVIEVDFDTMA